MHIAVGQADERAGNAAASPENHIGIGAACGADGFVLDRDAGLFSNGLEALDHFRVVAGAMSQGGAFAHAHITMCALVDAGIIRGVRDIHHQGYVRIERIGNLPRAK